VADLTIGGPSSATFGSKRVPPGLCESGSGDTVYCFGEPDETRRVEAPVPPVQGDVDWWSAGYQHEGEAAGHDHLADRIPQPDERTTAAATRVLASVA
jgi:hypothetical protein